MASCCTTLFNFTFRHHPNRNIYTLFICAFANFEMQTNYFFRFVLQLREGTANECEWWRACPIWHFVFQLGPSFLGWFPVLALLSPPYSHTHYFHQVKYTSEQRLNLLWQQSRAQANKQTNKFVPVPNVWFIASWFDCWVELSSSSSACTSPSQLLVARRIFKLTCRRHTAVHICRHDTTDHRPEHSTRLSLILSCASQSG